MKSLRFSFLAGVTLLAVLLACSFSIPGLSPAQPPSPPVPQQLPIRTIVPVPTDTAQAAPSATLAPVQLSGPPMEVGSMWPYVDGSILIAVPGGPFTMGHGGSDNPEHTVTLSDFWIYQAKVTNQQYALCVQAGKCATPDPVDDFTFNDITHANDPVVGVNWQQATDYCTFVHGQLPTEAQWEKTARGPDANIYPWGDNAPVCNLLNFNNCVGKITNTTVYPDGQSYYHGLDLEGNVFEWVNDWYDALYYKQGVDTDPLGPDKGQQRSVRSSSYKSKVDQIPASTRFFDSPKDHRRDLGFRCVVTDPTYFAPLCTAISLLGSGPGGSGTGALTPDCPQVSIGLDVKCQEGKVRVYVNDDHSPDKNATLDGLGGCTPVSVPPPGPGGALSFPQTYDCYSGTTATIESVCDYKGSSDPTCPAHYKLNGGVCEWDGTGSLGQNCLPGYTFDPALQCCSATPGTGKNFPICPLGTVLGSVKGQPACVPNGQAQQDPKDVEPITVKPVTSCTGGGQPGQPGNPQNPCPEGQNYVCSGTAPYQKCSCVTP